MKRRILLTIALSLSVVLLSLTRSDSTANAQNQMRQVADTGVVRHGPGQKIRVTVAAGDVNNDESVRVRFVRTAYTSGECSSGDVCKLNVVSQSTSAAMTLSTGEVAAVDGDFDLDGDVDGADFLVWRIAVLSNRQNVKVQGIVFDTSTQRVAAAVQMSMQRENQ